MGAVTQRPGLGSERVPDQARPGGYTRVAAEKSIQREIAAGEYVALDISKLCPTDRDDLKELVGSHPEWADKVAIY